MPTDPAPEFTPPDQWRHHDGSAVYRKGEAFISDHVVVQYLTDRDRLDRMVAASIPEVMERIDEREDRLDYDEVAADSVLLATKCLAAIDAEVERKQQEAGT